MKYKVLFRVLCISNKIFTRMKIFITLRVKYNYIILHNIYYIIKLYNII